MGAFRPSDIAGLLGVHVRKVWAWIHSGRLKAVNVTPDGDRPTWRIDPDDYREFRESLLNVKPERRRPRRHASDDVYQFIK